MTIYSLYIKIHKNTGIRYLGQTKQNPYTYPGSGIDWLSIIDKDKNSIETIVIFQSADKDEMCYWGRYYSKYYNVVEAMDDFGNKIWANRIPETGGGSGSRSKGIPRTSETIEKIKKNMPSQAGKHNGFFGKTHTPKTKERCGSSNKGKDIKSKEGKIAISNANKDHTIYTFINDIIKEQFTGIRQDFFVKYQIDRNSQSCFAKLINQKIKIYKGWKLL